MPFVQSFSINSMQTFTHEFSSHSNRNQNCCVCSKTGFAGHELFIDLMSWKISFSWYHKLSQIFRKIIIKYLSIRPQPARFGCIPSLFCWKIRYKISASFNFSGWENLNINRIKSGKFCAETKTVFREYWCGRKNISLAAFSISREIIAENYLPINLFITFCAQNFLQKSLSSFPRRKSFFHRKSADAWWKRNVEWCENSSNLYAKAKEEKRRGNFIEANKTDLSLRQRRFATSLSPRQSFA